MGAYLQITPALRSKLGYGCVRGCYYGPAGKIDRRSATSTEGETFECEIDLFNAEKDPFPYPDGHFSTVLCCELIEHLTEDPMHLMSEINRIVKPGGHLVLTTPNIGSLRGIAAILEGYHPGIFTAYIRPRADGEVEARHNREYTPKEIERLLLNSGFTVTLAGNRTVPPNSPPRGRLGAESARTVRPAARICAATISTWWAARPARSASAIRTGCTHERVRTRAYEDTDVRLSGELQVEARFNLRNTSGDPWRPEEGFAAGFHIYDSETGTLVVDGERQPPPGDVAPGGSVPVDLRFALPPEPGHYDVFISPMRENVCWFYTLGWPFLRVEAIVEDGRARLERVRVVTLRTIRRENLLRAVGRAFTLPISTIARNRSLIRTMVRRDILGRYRGSFGGVFWTILNPLLLMLTYFFVFGVVLRTRFGSDPSRAGFALYFLAECCPGWPSARRPDAPPR
jgi:SAM-dependent methyltransferase